MDALLQDIPKKKKGIDKALHVLMAETKRHHSFVLSLFFLQQKSNEIVKALYEHRSNILYQSFCWHYKYSQKFHHEFSQTKSLLVYESLQVAKMYYLVERICKPINFLS